MSSQTNPPSPEVLFADRHLVDTPEQIQLRFAIAGIGSRFLAIAIDSLIQAGVAIVLGLLLPIGFKLLQPAPGMQWLLAGVILLVFLLNFGYFAIFEIFWNGQTPGKRAIGIRVIKETGRPLSAIEVIGRNLLRIVDQIPGFYGIGILAAISNAQSKRLGDFVAGSIVVREKSLAEIRRALDGPALATPAHPALGASRLSPEEIAWIEAFLARREKLAIDVRRRIADQILRRIEPKLSLESARGSNGIAGVEAILEAAVHEYRSTGRY